MVGAKTREGMEQKKTSKKMTTIFFMVVIAMDLFVERKRRMSFAESVATSAASNPQNNFTIRLLIIVWRQLTRFRAVSGCIFFFGFGGL